MYIRRYQFSINIRFKALCNEQLNGSGVKLDAFDYAETNLDTEIGSMIVRQYLAAFGRTPRGKCYHSCHRPGA